MNTLKWFEDRKGKAVFKSTKPNDADVMTRHIISDPEKSFKEQEQGFIFEDITESEEPGGNVCVACEG